MVAAFDGHLECLKLLLAHPGVDVNKANRVRVWMEGEVGRGMQRLSE